MFYCYRKGSGYKWLFGFTIDNVKVSLYKIVHLMMSDAN